MWKSSVRLVEDNLYELVFKGSLAEGWHTYSTRNQFSCAEIEFAAGEGYIAEGGLYDISEPDEELEFHNEVVFGQKIRLTAASAQIKGELWFNACNEEACAAPETFEFSQEIITETASAAAGDSAEKESLLALILEAILWGLAMLLTPCVFPMVPMTVSFFMKGSSSAAAGRFKAMMYGIFIVALYTVPICLIIAATRIIGGESITADIFNWLATHWLPNILFFIIFMVFAASFFGAFEITLPSSLVNKSDKNADKGGLAGVFFMALTLVLVSFSCTGPIVGSVLIKSTRGEFWAPMITMLAFSTAFALPFTVFAFFPSILKKLKSGSGNWLGRIKIVLGFIELALGLKFLSVPDQTYHWGLLDREVYLAIWIVVFSLLGLYLLGKIQFRNQENDGKTGIFSLALSIITFSFVVYMIPGLFGAPLKGLSGYLPPMETQDFVIGEYQTPVAGGEQITSEESETIALGLTGFKSIEAGLEEARRTGKPLFIDITGYGCTNCREMESRVWSDPRVLGMLKNDFVITALHTDDKAKLPQNKWIEDENGKVFKTAGRVNSYIVRKRFNVNAQPNYVVLDTEGKMISPVRGYNLDVEAYIAFLQNALDAFNN